MSFPELSFISNGFKGEPQLVIKEQPQTRGFRFRYECEGQTHGGLRGESSTKSNKTYPEICIKNYNGPARIIISLYTDEANPKPHVHKLIGSNCNGGVYVLNITGDKPSVSIPDLVILHATKKKTADILYQRLLEIALAERSLSYGDNHCELSAEEMERIKKEADEQAKAMQLNVVRLHFQTFLQDPHNGQFTRVLPSVLSNPVYDSKSPGAAALKICRMDRHAGSSAGGDEVFLLCDKVQKDDIAVRFYEEDENDDLRWEAYGDFGPSDVHRQFAIVFRTPRYYRIINEPVQVKVQLKRLKDGEISDPKPFTYYPQTHDQEDIEKKKRKRLQGFDGMYPDPSGGGALGGGGTTGGGLYSTASYLPTVLNDNSSQYGVERYWQPPQPVQATAHYYRKKGVSPPRSEESSAKQSPNESISSDMIETDAPDFALPITVRPQTDANMTKVCPVFDTHIDSGVCVESDLEKSNLSVNADLKKKMKKLSLEQKPLSLEEKSPTKSASDKMPQTEAGARLDLYFTCHLAERLVQSVRLYAQSGNIVHLLMVQRHLLKLQNNDGDCVLHDAIIFGQIEALRTILEALSTLPDKTVFGQKNHLLQTPLHLACATNRADMIELLLKYPCPVDSADRRGNTVLHVAAKNGFTECMEAILQMDKKAIKHTINKRNYDGYTALHLAVINENLDCVKLLINHDADVQAEDGTTGRHPLHYAVLNGNLKIITYLRGLNVNAMSHDGNTPLHLAVTMKNLDAARMLMSLGADADIENHALLDSDDEREIDLEDDECLCSINSSLNSDNIIVSSEREGEDVSLNSSYNSDRVIMLNKRQDEEERYINGYTPRMLARDSLPMLRVLSGEIQSPVVRSISSNDIEDLLSRCHIKGDIVLLNDETRKKLAQLLDKKGDWQVLAEKLQLGGLISTFDSTESPTDRPIFDYTMSPTYKLISDYQTLNGSIDKLKQSLIAMNRDDCVKIIDSAFRL